MSYSKMDLRSFFKDVDEAGLSCHIDKEVDVAEEVPALCSQTFKPTMFSNLKGFDGFKLVDGLTRTRDMQKFALGLDCPDGAVIPSFLGMLGKGPSPTVILDAADAPVKEVVWTGEEANLHKLPIPVPSEGRDFPHVDVKKEDFNVPCISGGIVITRDPETELQNTFFSMAKVLDERRIHTFMAASHPNANLAAHIAKGERCPIAYAIGCHPRYEFGAVYAGPHEGFSEFNLISTLLGEPVPLVPAETVPLNVPAYAEIIIEGWIDPKREPYLHLSSHMDTHAPIFSNEPFVEITAITMRKNPIYRHIQPTRFTEHHALSEFAAAPLLLKTLLDQGLNIHDVAIPLHSGLNCAVVQMTPNNSEEVRTVLEIGMNFPILPRLTVVVDTDIDPYNVDDVLLAIATRVDSTKDLTTLAEGSGMMESLNTQVNSRDDVQLLPNPRWGIDATKPALDQPERRLLFSRLQARGEGRVRLEDYL